MQIKQSPNPKTKNFFRLPWRSVRDEETLMILKKDFAQSDCFRRLPRELRRLYFEMSSTAGPSTIDHTKILCEFTTALSRKNPDLQKKLPTFLNTEGPKVSPPRLRARKDKQLQNAPAPGAAIPITSN